MEVPIIWGRRNTMEGQKPGNLITCRMAHVYSLGLMLGHEGSGELADAALKGLKESFTMKKRWLVCRCNTGRRYCAQ